MGLGRGSETDIKTLRKVLTIIMMYTIGRSYLPLSLEKLVKLKKNTTAEAKWY